MPTAQDEEAPPPSYNELEASGEIGEHHKEATIHFHCVPLLSAWSTILTISIACLIIYVAILHSALKECTSLKIN